MLPDPVYARVLLARALALWLGARLGFALVVAVTPLASLFGPPALALRLPAALAVIALAGLLGAIDLTRRREHVLLANLGVSRAAVAVLSMLPALAAESIITVAAGT